MAPIISALLTIFGIMAFGFITERRKLFPQSMGLCLNRFVYWVSLPALLFTQMCTIPMDESTRALVWGGLAASFIGYAAFYFAFSLGFRKNGPEATLRTLGTCFPNAAFFGLPFVIMVYPGSDAAINANMLCALLYTGVSILADVSLELFRGARQRGEQNGAASARSATLRRIGRELAKNPMLQASAAGLLIGMSGLPLPEAVLRISSMLGSTCAPLALFSMGMALAAQISGALGPFSLRASLLPLSLIAVGKLFLYPLLAYFVMSLAGCTGVMLAAATVTFAMPVAVLVYILAERDGSCVAEIFMAVVSTTALSLATLPLVMAALSFVGLY
jgi:predicted permease